jgi:rSAM/selenodomain-associated transferase 1
MTDALKTSRAINSGGRLLVFAKAPVPGTVKTRLMPSIDAEACARLYERLIEGALQTATRAELCSVELWCAPDRTHPFFEECAQKFGVRTCAQKGDSLGMRMHNALASALPTCSMCVLIGCDCPALDAEYLVQAFEALDNGCRVVLGPAEDGGYVLIGARRTTKHLFERIDWGEPTVLNYTRARLRKLRWDWRELKTLWDVDRPADLERLAALELDRLDSLKPAATRASRLESTGSKDQPGPGALP